MKKIPLFLLAGMTLLFSCSKNDDDPVTPPDTTKEEAQKLQKDVQGKWLFNTDIELGRKAISSEGRKSQRSLMGRALPQQVETNGTAGTTGVTGDVPGFIEFTSDSSYIIYDENQQVYTGKFEAKSGDSIVLSGIGYLTGITINNGKMDFKLFYSATSKTITIATNKAAAIPVDDRTTLLTKGPWYITKEESGADMIGSEEWEIDGNGQEVSYIIDSVSFLISNNGTYLVQIFSGKKLKNASMANWKWHSKQADKFVYAWDNEPFDEENNDIQITELTATSLKVTEAWDSNGDGIDDTTDKWVLKPAR
jgi:hypothetical protein